MDLTFVLHPHTEPEGWRWAVHLCPPGAIGRDQGDGANPFLFRVVAAGWAPTHQTADLDGQAVLYAVLRALSLVGMPVTPDQVHTLQLDHDPFAGKALTAVVQPNPMFAINEVTD